MDSITQIKDKKFQTKVKKRLGKVIEGKCELNASLTLNILFLLNNQDLWSLQFLFDFFNSF